MNRYWRFLVEYVTPRSPTPSGREDQQARITYFRSRDERRAREALRPRTGNVEVQPKGKRS